MFELVWGVSDIVSVIIIAMDLYCIPKCTGLEGTGFKELLMIAFGLKNADQPEVRLIIVKFVFIPRIGICVVFFIIEFGLLLNEEINLRDPSLYLVIIFLVLLIVYLIIMIYFAFSDKKCIFDNISVHQLFVFGFHVLDMLVNLAMFLLAYEINYKEVKPGLNITFLIFIFTIYDFGLCLIQVIKSGTFMLYSYCKNKISTRHNDLSTEIQVTFTVETMITCTTMSSFPT